jgi:hypothetical protein
MLEDRGYMLKEGGYKVWITNNANFANLVFVNSQLKLHPILKISVSTPYNYLLIMGSRHKNF